MVNKEILIGILRDNPQGLTIEELSSRSKLNRQTIAKYLAELKGEGVIIIRHVGQAKLHYWDFKRAKSKEMR